MDFLKIFLVTGVIFMVIDLLYLGVIGGKFVKSQLGHLMGDIRWPIAVLFYIQYVVGLIYFVIDPALRIGDPEDAFINGALYGFFLYATYELTNYSTLKKWPKGFVIPDLIWGTVLTSLVSIVTFTILN